MTIAPSPRRGSFLATWRLFSSGWQSPWLYAVMAIGLPALAFSMMPRVSFVSFASMLVFTCAIGTLFFEAGVTNRLEFMAVVPQPIDTRWLVLAPMCANGVASAIAMVIVGQSPPVAGLSLIGLACWTAGSTRWLRRLTFWPLGLPVPLLAPVAVFGAWRAGGWGAASAASMAMGLGALAFQPRVRFGGGSAGRVARGRAPMAPRPRIEQRAVSIVEGGGPSALISAVRFLCVATAHLRVLYAFMFPLAVLSIVVFPFPGQSLFIYIFATPAEVIAVAYAREMHEFVRPLPFSARVRRVSGLLFPLLIALAFCVLTLALLNLEWLNGGALPGRLFNHRSLNPDIRYLRDVLGATFLPEKWPAGGLTVDLWLRVRPLLHLDLGRTTLFMVAALFTRATLPLYQRERKNPVPLLGVALLVLIAASALRLSSDGVMHNLPLPSIWFAALLAAVAIAHWVWRVRAANASNAATGSSTAG